MKKFVVIGLGNFGFHVAKELYEDGHEVVAIDIDRNRVQNVGPYATQAMVINSTDKSSLKSLGLETADAVIVATGASISASIITCLYLNEIGVANILAKAVDEDHEKILKKVGATSVIHPERDMALRVARGLSKPNLLDFMPLAEGYELAEVGPPREFIGKSLAQLNLRAKYDVYVVAVQETVPENFVLVPPAEFVLKDSDIMIMLGRTESIDRIKGLD